MPRGPRSRSASASPVGAGAADVEAGARGLGPIDAQQGLQYVEGDTAFYQELLKDFAVEFGGSSAAMKSFVSRGQLQEARALAHKLKGSALYLGLQWLQVAVTEIERGLDGDLVEPHHLTAFERAMAHTLAAIQAYGRAEPAAGMQGRPSGASP